MNGFPTHLSLIVFASFQPRRARFPAHVVEISATKGPSTNKWPSLLDAYDWSGQPYTIGGNGSGKDADCACATGSGGGGVDVKSVAPGVFIAPRLSES